MECPGAAAPSVLGESLRWSKLQSTAADDKGEGFGHTGAIVGAIVSER